MSVAREMASAFAALVKSYAETFDVPQEEAAQRVAEGAAAGAERLDLPARSGAVARLEHPGPRDPELARALGGDQAGGPAGAGERTPGRRGAWVRGERLLAEGAVPGRAERAGRSWRPRNGLEWQLIDTMAQAQTLMQLWQVNLVALTLLAARAVKPDPERPGHPLGRRLSEAERTEEAASMVERRHRQFLKTLGRARGSAPPAARRRAPGRSGQHRGAAGQPGAVSGLTCTVGADGQVADLAEQGHSGGRSARSAVRVGPAIGNTFQ